MMRIIRKKAKAGQPRRKSAEHIYRFDAFSQNKRHVEWRQRHHEENHWHIALVPGYMDTVIDIYNHGSECEINMEDAKSHFFVNQTNTSVHYSQINPALFGRE
jgi:hypothetical protein